MMYDMNSPIKPYDGIGSIKLAMTIEEIRVYLKNNHIAFDQWIEPNKGIEPEIPWTIIRIDKSITLAFVDDVLFEITLQDKFKGLLPNGICIDMPMKEVEHLDSSLMYNEEDENFISDNGYWIEDEIESGNVVSITIFLPEVEQDDESFWTYKWINKYK